MKRSWLTYLFVLGLSSAAGRADDHMQLTYGFEYGNTLHGYHFGQHENRHGLIHEFSKKLPFATLSSETHLLYSTIDKGYISTIRFNLNNIRIGEAKASITLGDYGNHMPPFSGFGGQRRRGISLQYDRKTVKVSLFGGAQSETYRSNRSLQSRYTYGTVVEYRPIDWLRNKTYLIADIKKEASDSMDRMSVGFGHQADISTMDKLIITLAGGIKRRQEEHAWGFNYRTAPAAALNLSWLKKTYGLGCGFNFTAAHYQPLQKRSTYGPVFSAWLNPNKFMRFQANLSNQTAEGDTLYPWSINTVNLGTQLDLPNVPTFGFDYRNTDNSVDQHSPMERHYTSSDKSIELKHSYPILDLLGRMRYSNRREIERNSQDYAMQSYYLQPTYVAGLNRFWISYEYEQWKDYTSSSYSGKNWRVYLGGDAKLWTGSQAIASLGFRPKYNSDNRGVRWLSNLQFVTKISQSYSLAVSWWNENNISQDTGFFYVPDYNRFKLTISRRFELSGSSIEGTVFLDLDKDRKQENGEIGIAGVTVVTRDGRRAITDVKGHYRITNITDSRTTVKIELATLSADYDVIGPTEVSTSLGGWRVPDVNFGVSTLGSIKGRVFVDGNGNELYDSLDYGLSGVTMTLKPCNKIIMSNGGGYFRFTNVPTGTQLLQVNLAQLPPDYELVGESAKIVKIQQGIITNNIDFVLKRRERPVKKVVFDGETIIPIQIIPEARAAELPKPPRALSKPKSTTQPITAPTFTPSEINGLLKEGTRLYSAGNYEAALKVWQRILRSDPRNAKARDYLERTRKKLESQRKAKGG